MEFATKDLGITLAAAANGVYMIIACAATCTGTVQQIVIGEKVKEIDKVHMMDLKAALQKLIDDLGDGT